MQRNSAGRLFHVTGPANEKARSPNLVFRCGMVYWWCLRRNACSSVERRRDNKFLHIIIVERGDTYTAIAVLLKDLRWHRCGVVNTPHPSTKFTLVFLVDCDVTLHKRDAFYLKNLQQIYLLPTNL